MTIKEVINGNLVVELAKADEGLLIEMQTILAKLGYYTGRIDGLYGNKTQTAWMSFKKSQYQGDYNLVGAGSLKLLQEKGNIAPIHIKVGNDLAGRIYNVCKNRHFNLNLRPGAVNIIGLEGMNIYGVKNDDSPNGWNDSIGLLVFEDNVPKLKMICKGTTEPGRYYTMNPLNRGGCARLQLGQHKNIWAVGRHRGYEAMQQVGRATLVRDKNRNYFRDDAVSVESGNGINLHTTKTTGWRGGIGSFIGQWSAGCVVIRDPQEFLTFMKHIKSSLQYKINPRATFDFTLLWRDWFSN